MAYAINAADGAGEIQQALDDLAGDEVHVEGDGDYEWRESIEIPNETGLSVDDIEVVVPENHDITAFSAGSRDVYSLITTKDRTDAQGVELVGGNYDLSAMPDIGPYAGLWLHRASNSRMENVHVDGSGAAIRGNRSFRGFGVTVTDCDNPVLRGCTAFGSAYDDFGIRGRNRDPYLYRCGSYGDMLSGTSGTIQTAGWGRWGLQGSNTGAVFDQCFGPRIYCHGSRDTTWRACQSDYRLQTIGVRGSAIFEDSHGFEGKVLVYALDNDQPFTRIHNFEFVEEGRDRAIQIGPNGGQDIGEVEIDTIFSNRPNFLHFENYSTNSDIDSVGISNAYLYGKGSDSTLISQDHGAPEADELILRNVVASDFAAGISGSYGRVVLENVDFYGIEDPLAQIDAPIDQTNVNVHDSPADVVEWEGEPVNTGGSSPTGQPLQVIPTELTNRPGKAQASERFVATLDELRDREDGGSDDT